MTVTTNRTELSETEIERIVAEAMAAEASAAASEAQPPSSAVVWWRAQMRARREAAEIAERPIAIVHAVSIAAAAGLLLSVIGYVIAAVKGSVDGVTTVWQSFATAFAPLPIELTGRWLSIGLTAMLVSVIVASIAAYVIYADE
jgi:hypothetical protein